MAHFSNGHRVVVIGKRKSVIEHTAEKYFSAGHGWFLLLLVNKVPQSVLVRRD